MITFFNTAMANVCFNNAVGVADTNIIPDNRMTASSHYGPKYRAYYGRLNANREKGWCPGSATGEWLQVDLGATIEICGVATQGDIEGYEWTKDFKLSFSSDGSGWTTYMDGGSGKVRLDFIVTSNS